MWNSIVYGLCSTYIRWTPHSRAEGATLYPSCNGEIIVAAGCSDYRQDAFFDSLSREVTDRQGLVYRVRTPAVSVLWALHPIFIFLAAPFFRRGAKIVVLRYHRDCAGAMDLFNGDLFGDHFGGQFLGPCLRLLWRVLRIHDAETLNEWVMVRTIHNLERADKKNGWGLTIFNEIVDADSSKFDPRILDALYPPARPV